MSTKENEVGNIKLPTNVWQVLPSNKYLKSVLLSFYMRIARCGNVDEAYDKIHNSTQEEIMDLVEKFVDYENGKNIEFNITTEHEKENDNFHIPDIKMNINSFKTSFVKKVIKKKHKEDLENMGNDNFLHDLDMENPYDLSLSSDEDSSDPLEDED